MKKIDTSGYSNDDNRPLPIREIKKVIGMMKDELGGKIMTEFVALRGEMYVYRSGGKVLQRYKKVCCF